MENLADLMIYEGHERMVAERNALAMDLLRLTQERDALAIDAARYRWLRDKADHMDGPAVYLSTGYGEGYGDLSGSDLDGRVDTAMRGDY
jgi:hypothetical protein